MRGPTSASKLGLVAVLAVLGGCPGDTADDAGQPGGGASGKADSLDVTCPSEVTLNGAEGSQKRCVDTGSGQFVATECCADVCDGAGWREQSNGSTCAWLGEPGLPGAAVGQFAPRLCCELNDALACDRAELSGGSCTDPDGGAIVDPVCCDADDASSCHPAVRSGLRACVDQVIESFASDPESAPLDVLTALELCRDEGDLMGPMFDELCAVDGDRTFCSVDFETFALDFVAPCAEELRPELDCALGRVYRDLFDAENVHVVHQEQLRAEDIAGLDALTGEQVLVAVAQSAAGELATLEDAFEAADGGEINVTQLFELGNERAFTAYELGAGDNSFGAIFDHGTATIAARIIDGDLYDGSSPPQLGCRIPLGVAGRRCSSDVECPGLECFATVEHPLFGTLGRCVNEALGDGSPQNGADCHGELDCPLEDGLVCSGLGLFGDDLGFCRPAWMFGRFEDAMTAEIPDGGVLERDIFVFGLATVPEEARIVVRLQHPDPSQVRITLRPALQEEGTLSPVFDGAAEAGGEAGGEGGAGPAIVIDRAILHPGDESLVGRWTLVVEDLAATGVGAIEGWEMRFSSRFD